MIAVVGIFVAAANLIGALAKQFTHLVSNVALPLPIFNDAGQHIAQPNLPVNFPQIQDASVWS